MNCVPVYDLEWGGGRQGFLKQTLQVVPHSLHHGVGAKRVDFTQR